MGTRNEAAVPIPRTRRRIRRSALLPNDMMIYVILGALDVLASIITGFAAGFAEGAIVLGVGGLWIGFFWWHARQR